MTSIYTPTDHGTTVGEFALVARVVTPTDLGRNGTAQSASEHVLDHAELTDLVAEAIAESQRVHGGVHGHTHWNDAAVAAALILRHVAEVCGVQPERSDSESKFLADGGVSSDHA